jgi:hypothetical protein
MSKKPMFRQPDPEAIDQELKRRQEQEAKSHGLLDGKRIKRVDRPVQIELKTSEDKKKQFDRLRLLTMLSYTEIFERALDAFEAEWNRKHK